MSEYSQYLSPTEDIIEDDAPPTGPAASDDPGNNIREEMDIAKGASAVSSV